LSNLEIIALRQTGIAVAFFVDVLIACLPMLNANRLHGLWGAIIVYLIVLATLRSADGWAVRKSWRWAGRLLLKIVIYVVATGLVSVSGLEQCDSTAINCRRVFSATAGGQQMQWWQIVGVVVVALLIWQGAMYFLGNPKFWRLVGRNPDLALPLFSIESGCIVDGVPPAERKKNYVGPFRFMTSDGVMHVVYILRADIAAIQARVSKPLDMAEGRIA
jgi:hypothetical protein